MEFRIITHVDRKAPFNRAYPLNMTRDPSELTVEESLELIKQLIENLKCKECKGSGKALISIPTPHDMAYGKTAESYEPCTACHGSGRSPQLVEVVKLCFPEIDSKAIEWINDNYEPYSDDGCGRLGIRTKRKFQWFLDYLKEQK